MFLAPQAQCFLADGQQHTELVEASGWPSSITFCLSILEATKPEVGANGCIMGEERWSISEQDINKEKREMLWGQVTFWDQVDARGQEVTATLSPDVSGNKEAWVGSTAIGPNTFSQENAGLRLLGFPWWGSATLFLSLSLIYGALGSRGPNQVRWASIGYYQPSSSTMTPAQKPCLPDSHNQTRGWWWLTTPLGRTCIFVSSEPFSKPVLSIKTFCGNGNFLWHLT